MKSITSVVFTILFLNLFTAYGQTKYFTKNGTVIFNASSSHEKIEAINEKAMSIIDLNSGTIEISVLMKAFLFEKALMQEHFNENYVESDRYPKSKFKGNVINISTVTINKDGDYPVKIKGMLTLHGETKEVLADGILTVKEGNIIAGKSEFKIKLDDFKIDIPSVVKDKISKIATIRVDINYVPYKNS